MAKSDKATAETIDFTNVKEGGSFSKKRYPAGDYEAVVTKVQNAKSKSDGLKMWLFTITVKSATYPYYCKFQENQLWKIRGLAIACGLNVPKKRTSIDPNKLVGKKIGVTLEDDEYEGKAQSVIASVFPASELDDEQVAASGLDDDEPKKKDKKKTETSGDGGKDKGGKKKKAEPEPEPEPEKGKKDKKGKKNKEMKELDVDDI